MTQSSKKAFAARLGEALADAGYRSTRAKSGADVKPLKDIAGVTREMARRYAEGTALPRADKLNDIATKLGVRVAWLRDGEGPKRIEPGMVAQPGAIYLSEEALEVARTWLLLPEARQQVFRELIFMEAAVNRLLPWLRTHKPTTENYASFERDVQKDFARLTRQLPLDIS